MGKYPLRHTRTNRELCVELGGNTRPVSKGQYLQITKTHNPLIISGKKAEIKLSFVSVNEKKVEICDLVSRNHWFFS